MTIRYFAREKIPGVYHHAKAGNLNNAILKEGTSGQFLVIFDCDMVCDAPFLQALLPHFYNRVSALRHRLTLRLGQQPCLNETPKALLLNCESPSW